MSDCLLLTLGYVSWWICRLSLGLFYGQPVHGVLSILPRLRGMPHFRSNI